MSDTLSQNVSDNMSDTLSQNVSDNMSDTLSQDVSQNLYSGLRQDLSPMNTTSYPINKNNGYDARYIEEENILEKEQEYNMRKHMYLYSLMSILENSLIPVHQKTEVGQEIINEYSKDSIFREFMEFLE